MNDAHLRPLTLADALAVCRWRWEPETRKGLRGDEPLTPERQTEWYYREPCRPEQSKSRYYAVESDGLFVAQVSLETFTDRNGNVLNVPPLFYQKDQGKAEIGLITPGAVRGRGYGRAALSLLFWEAFKTKNLDHIWGVCYGCNDAALGFWQKMLDEFGGTPFEKSWDDKHVKMWDGVKYPGYLFTFTVEAWRERRAA